MSRRIWKVTVRWIVWSAEMVGKTEVAIRAAFKAVADNKQVAVLVPTTVLAYQHFQTFKERLKGLPCRVEYLSRARTAAQTKAVLKGLKDGDVGILIGTHPYLGKRCPV